VTDTRRTTGHRCEGACLVPPDPNVLADLRMRYRDLREGDALPDVTFEQFLAVWRVERRPPPTRGLDDGRMSAQAGGPELIDRPQEPLRADVRTIVLLVDFPDREHHPNHTPSWFERLLFSLGEVETGSMRDYYRRVSGHDRGQAEAIDVVGDVAGWFRLPRPLTDYAGGSSGMRGAFPRNAKGMAHDAVQAAIDAGVDLSSAHVREERITALFIIHAGRGAEQTQSVDDIWSHKWALDEPFAIPGLDVSVSTYLTVPEDCKMGVCAHEWGHLAAQWADYYDTDKGNLKSHGLGTYCLMAAGSWANSGLSPTMPTAMLRMFHGWVAPTHVTASTTVELEGAADGGDPVFIHNPATMRDDQYVLVEYRRRSGLDTHLPDDGVAVYVVDESIVDVSDQANLAIKLLQADGLDDLAQGFNRGNDGDSEDLFGDGATIDATTNPSLVLPDGTDPGIRIEVHGTPGADTMSITVTI
jgi:immune inhibitor A